MKRLCTVLLVSFMAFVALNAQNIRGIRIESSSYPVVVYMNDVQINTASHSCFIANLSPGHYKIEVYRAHNNSRRRGERHVYSDRVYFDGRGIKDIIISGEDRPNHPADNRLPLMDERRFEEFLKSIKNEPFDSGKQNIINLALTSNGFTCEQVKIISRLYSFDSERLPAMKRFYPRIVDKENVFILIDLFDHQSSKNEFMKFVEQYKR